MPVLRHLARISAYVIALLLALVWSVSAVATFLHPLFDLGRPYVGDTIIFVARAAALPAEFVLSVAKLLAGLKLMVGLLLLAAVLVALAEKARGLRCDDAMLDCALFVASIAALAGALPGLLYGGDLLVSTIGELMLCVIASLLAVAGRGYLVADEHPKPTRPAFG